MESGNGIDRGLVGSNLYAFSPSEAARQCTKDMTEWRYLVHILMVSTSRTFSIGSSVLSDRPPVLWWIITMRGVGCRYIMRLG